MQTFRNILLYTDPAVEDSARGRAVRLAVENEARLTLMNVVKPLPARRGITNSVDETKELQHVIVSDRRRQLLDLARDYSDTGVVPNVVVAVGDPGYETSRCVVRGKHDLLIKTADGVDLFNREFESFSQSLLRLCPCPVWLLKPDPRGQFNCVVAAIDASVGGRGNRDLNRRILEHASLIAKRESAALHVVSIWNGGMETPLRTKMGGEIIDVKSTEYESQLRGHLDGLLGDINLQVREIFRHVYRGNAVEAIRKTVEQVNADLVVMSLPCRTGISGLLIGNTAELVLNDAKCSVFAIKPDALSHQSRVSHQRQVSDGMLLPNIVCELET